MPDVEITARDERSIRVPVPANTELTATLVAWLGKNFQDGYTIASADSIQAGTQRDPYVVGLRITMERTP